MTAIAENLTATAAVATGSEWLAAIASTAVAASGKPPVPVLAMAKVFTDNGGLYLQTYDYATSATVRVADHAEQVAPFLVNHAWLGSTLKTLLGKDKSVLAGLGMEADKVVLRCDGYEIPADTAPVAEFPAPPAAGAPFAAVGTEALRTSVARTSVAVSKDEYLPILTAIRFEASHGELTLAATDRYRLAFDNIPARVSTDTGFQISSKTLGSVVKQLAGEAVTFGTDGERVISITDGPDVYTMLQQDGEFPRIRGLIGDNHATVVELDRTKLVATVTVAGKLAERNMPVLVTITDKGAMVTADPAAKSPLAAAEWLRGDTSGSYVVGFSPRYLLEALKSFSGDTIRFSQHTPAKPAAFSDAGTDAADDSAFRHLLMPTRQAS